MWCSRLLWRRVTVPPVSMRVVADPVVGGRSCAGGEGFGAGGVGLRRGCAGRGLGGAGWCCSRRRNRFSWCCSAGSCGRWLGGQPLLLGLVEPLHFAAGLRMVGPGVIEPHAPGRPSSTSKATRPSPRCLPVKTAPLSVSTLAGIPHRVKAFAEAWPPHRRRWCCGGHHCPAHSREWSSTMFMIEIRCRRPAANG